MSKLTKSNSHSIYRPSGSTRVSRKRIYRIPNPKMNGGGFLSSIFGGVMDEPKPAATDSADMSTTPSSVETPNEGMPGSVETPSVTNDNMNMSGSVDTPSPSGSVETSITTPDNMPGSVDTPSPSESVDTISDMSTSANTISPIDNSFPKDDTPAKDASTSSSIMDTISGAYNAAKDSFTNEVEGAAASTSIDKSPSMDTSSDTESIEEDDIVEKEPVIRDFIKLLSDRDAQISTLLDQLKSANNNFADANNKLVECLTSKISSEDTLAQSSPMMSEMSSIGPAMGSPGPEMDSPGFPMSEANTSGSDVETPLGQSPTESMGVESNKGGKTRNRVKKQRRTRRKQMRG